MCNTGHGHRQLWTKYVVHIMLHKNVRTLTYSFENCLKCTENRKHDKYSDNGKYRPYSSNNRSTGELGLTPAPVGGERLLLPVPQDFCSSQSRSRHCRRMKGGRSSHSCSTPTVFPRDITAPAPMQTAHPICSLRIFRISRSGLCIRVIVSKSQKHASVTKCTHLRVVHLQLKSDLVSAVK